MSKKRSKRTEDRSLLATIDEQLSAAAEEIFWLLKERGQVKMEQLKEQVTERINAAVEIIFTAFGVSRAEATVPPQTHGREQCPADGHQKQNDEDLLPNTSSRPHYVSDPAREEEEEPPPHCCRVCGKSFNRKGFLMKHVDKHLKEAEPVCGLCGERLESNDGLRLHLQTHRDISRTCHICSKKFPSIRAQEIHLRLHTGEKPFGCHICGKGFNQKGNMLTHMRIHTAKKPFRCIVCHKEFSHAGSLERHIKVHKRQTPFSCKGCGKSFGKSAELRRHVRIHEPVDVHAARSRRRKPSLTPSHCCKVCGNAFHNKGNFVRHAETHVNAAECRCGVCGEQMKSLESLQLHVQSHREANRMCDICGISFRDMEIHKRTHTGQKPFHCKDCGKDFPRKGSLERHMKLHAGVRPYICEYCGKTFIESTVLKRHIKSHTGGKPRTYKCDICNKTFTMSQHLDVHKRIHTGEKPYTCRVCGKNFRQIGNLDSHMRIHTGEKPFICSLCGKRFRQKISLETHERFHKKEKPFSCELCTKGFVQKIDLKRHMLTHTGEKPYSCNVCGKSYQEKRSVEAHMKVHSGEGPARDSERTPNLSHQDGCHTNFIQLMLFSRHAFINQCLLPTSPHVTACSSVWQRSSLFVVPSSRVHCSLPTLQRTVVDAELRACVRRPAGSLCPQKKSKMCAVRLLRVSVHKRLGAAAEDVLLRVEKGEEAAEIAGLRALLTERLAEAAEEIVGLFEETVAEYEDRAERSEREISRQRRLLDAVLKPEVKLHRADVKPLLETEEEHEWISSLDQEDTETLYIKEELRTSQEAEQLKGLEELDMKVLLTPVKSEEEAQSLQLGQRQIRQMGTDGEGENCGGPEPEPDRNSVSDLQRVNGDNSPGSSETDDSDWSHTNKALLRVDSQKLCKDSESDISSSAKERPFPCSYCGKTFSLKGNLNRHVRDHTGERPFPCTGCDKTFKDSGSLTAHMRCHTGEQPYSCLFCGKNFSGRGNMTRHMRIHTGEKPFTCLVCSKSFHVKEHLNRHMKYHTGEKPFSCSICGKGCAQKTDLKKHMRVHTGEKPFSCPFCGKCCAEKGDLTKHMRVHTGEKPFSCNVCGKSCAQKGSLKIHMRVHTGEKPFSCSVCGKCFTVTGHLKRHMKQHSDSGANRQNAGGEPGGGDADIGCDGSGSELAAGEDGADVK
ncbi:uncharacterized protein AB9W97_001078 [Spinachia spinachia]